MIVEVIDNFLDENECKAIHKEMKKQKWQFYHGSEPQYIVENRVNSWSVTTLSNASSKVAKAIVNTFGEKYSLSKAPSDQSFYMNAHTFGVEPEAHIDNGYNFSCIYYPNMDWKLRWGGGTVVYNEDLTDVEKYVAYKSNRLLLFESFRMHQAMPVTRKCNELRTCIVMKFRKDKSQPDRINHGDRRGEKPILHSKWYED